MVDIIMSYANNYYDTRVNFIKYMLNKCYKMGSVY